MMHTYRTLVGMVRRRWPALRFTIRRVKCPKNIAGDCSKITSTHYRIRIDRSLSEQAALDTLVHEVAHALAWHEYEHGEEHGPFWGFCISQVYALYELALEQSENGKGDDKPLPS